MVGFWGWGVGGGGGGGFEEGAVLGLGSTDGKGRSEDKDCRLKTEEGLFF